MPTINLGRKAKINYPKNDFNNNIQKLYNSKMWKRLRLYYLKQHPICEKCLPVIISAKEIHHIIEISTGKNIDEMLEILLDENNLESLCLMHHHQIHNSK